MHFDSFVPKHFCKKIIDIQMNLASNASRGGDVGRDELAHARRKSRRLLAVVSLSFGVGETNCSQGIGETTRTLYDGCRQNSKRLLNQLYYFRAEICLGNTPHPVCQYPNMAPRLLGQTSLFGVVFFVSKSLSGIEGQKRLKEFTILTRKTRSHVKILIYRTWPIVKEGKTMRTKMTIISCIF